MSFFDQVKETAPRERLRKLQFDKLQRLLREISGRNRFYTKKWKDAGIVLPFLGVEAIAAGNLAKKSLQLVELKLSQAFAWRRFFDLVEEGHRFFFSPRKRIRFHNMKSCFTI